MRILQEGMNIMGIEVIINISHKYGSDSRYVLAGGGNTSYKDNENLYIKGSGTALATISESGFVKMSRKALASIWNKKYSNDKDEREAQVLEDMMSSRCVGEENKRPSVETLLHNLFSQKYVLHVHPTMVNGLTCSNDGEQAMKLMFDNAIWIEETEPGYVLANVCRQKIEEYEKQTGKNAELLFLQNHGIFFAADTEEGIDILVSNVMSKLEEKIIRKPDLTEVEYDEDAVSFISPALRMAYDKEGGAVVKFVTNKEVERLCSSKDEFEVLMRSMSPDHIVYCKATPLFIESFDADMIADIFKAFEDKYRYLPKIVFVKDVGMFAIGKNIKDVNTVADVWLDAVKISVYAQNFGGVRHMAPEMVDFIVNWEVESYRSKVALKENGEKQLAGKIAIVTGAARGFGEGIAKKLAQNGAYVVCADINYEGVRNVASQICNDNGSGSAFPIEADVTNENNVKNMINQAIIQYGGVDIFISNVGVVNAGASNELSVDKFKELTEINYTSYFTCVKYAQNPMKIQRKVSPEYMSDIIQINSKSGLGGSYKNFSYSGSKFGGIGLTQSFALELAEYGIKVNAVCPGNYLDGPLWSDPKNGLFIQYLTAKKIPGAKTVDDLRKYYEEKVPLKRGCTVDDVFKAIMYIIDQKYETGQALPVTGGQVMLS